MPGAFVWSNLKFRIGNWELSTKLPAPSSRSGDFLNSPNRWIRLAESLEPPAAAAKLI